jgi:hypothetical protein
MSQERRYLDSALEAGQYALTALDTAIDTLLMKEDPALVVHETLHKVYEAREALAAALGALRRLERLQQVERLERGDKGP